ncbi:aspartate ammonia-lyase [Candidatus Uhrbacteria bacterium RIFCSPHIGHO2_12_FULL_54_23]|uniref:Aspartate ammonia-lyase n=3 Tax=Parcubacteria group TaxID=1794811 RepID=A0A1F7UGV5_9BACT|nr:MAG: Fumarate hydratase class II [Candidatus Magasanikbacteria bacterium GW2011_GWA2_50_22]OGL77499.1 MAG: aspartate ammonia-lyase [Candidatus Uhrbacteria bacterium RIFCSPHIGHO2_12_FULL_54_23]OGL90900.1 MAG: aspartate ammonia-lyase [Candidatus Uhrbacteria bacterium RIFCSPLOWO2_02_FULL_54_37]
MPSKFRIEKDSLGRVKVPRDAYWGAQTQRAIENFQISGLRLPPEFIRAQAVIKRASTASNAKLQKLPTKLSEAIVEACEEVMRGKFNDQFVVDAYQAGAGTSQNMNINEVAANCANELLGKKKGAYKPIHPNDHVNMSQSTNDTFPSALFIACFRSVQKTLLPALKILEASLQKKAKEFKKIKKTGRTHLQDAVPLTLGDEFGAYAATIGYHRRQIENISKELLAINLGGTAVGSGLNAGTKFRELALKEIRRITGYPFKSNPNLFAGTQNVDAVISLSSALRNYAVSLGKIASDLQLLSSGPVSGFDEIRLPAVQPGSSIMPGKVNPSIPEMVTMVCFQTMGMDLAVSLAGQAAQLELNAMMPIIAYDILHVLTILSHASQTFADKCVKGIKANKKKIEYYLDRNPMVATELNEKLGYDKVAKMVQRAYRNGSL